MESSTFGRSSGGRREGTAPGPWMAIALLRGALPFHTAAGRKDAPPDGRPFVPGLRQALLKNLGIKITSVILALAVYAHVYAREEREAVVRLPLGVEGLAPGLVCRGEIPSGVRVRVRARGLELIKLRASPPQTIIRLEQAREGLLLRPVTGADVVLPASSEAIVLGLAEPVVLSLTVERSVTRTVPIALRTEGAPAEGFAQVGRIEARPETLAVTGPQSVVEQLDSLWTEPIGLAGRTASFTAEALLVVPAETRLRQTSVQARVPIAAVVRRSIGPVAVGLAPGLRGSVTVAPESARVVVEGPGALLARIGAPDVRVRVELGAPVHGNDLVPLRAALPVALRSQVRVIEIDPPAVVLVRKNS